MRDKSHNGFCNQYEIMEQLINHGGGLEKLVKEGWERYNWQERKKKIRRSLSVNHYFIPMIENKRELEN
jgi:hypothetical protein